MCQTLSNVAALGATPTPPGASREKHGLYEHELPRDPAIVRLARRYRNLTRQQLLS